MHSIVKLTFVFCFLGWTHASFAQPNQNDLMIVVGDSISAGFNANTHAVNDTPSTPFELDFNSPLLFPTVPRFSSPFPRHNVPEWKLGLAQLMNHKEDLSWASGDAISSHSIYLKKYLALHEPETILTVANVAVSGAQSVDLAGEAEQILKIWETRQYRSIRYLTFLMGTNDACIDWISGGIPERQIIRSIKEFFAKISVIQQKEPIRVLVSALPKIPDLAMPAIFNYPLTPKKDCRTEATQVVKYCNPLLDWTDSSTYAKRVEIMARKNAAIKKAITEVASAYPQFDFAYSESLFNFPLSIDVLADDCFHPNELGQKSISDLLWNDQPWFK